MANHFGNNPVFLDDTANGDRFATPPSCWKVLQYPLTDSYQKQVLYIYKSMIWTNKLHDRSINKEVLYIPYTILVGEPI